MIALHHLTTSGWVLLALTVACALSFPARRRWTGENAFAHAFVLGIMLVWMLWLVTP